MNNVDSIPTRQSLLVRLKDLGDQKSWSEFFEAYWRLIHATALKAGLTEVEAQEVVQEVMIAAAKKMPGFTYEPGKDSLKGWLLGVTRWKVADQFRRRKKEAPALTPSLSHPMGEGVRRAGEGRESDDDTARTATVERMPDPASFALDAIWDGEWRENLARAALERVRQTVNPAHYEMYHLHVVQGLPPRETARALGVSTAAVYLAKFRVGKLLQREVKKLESKLV